MNQRNSSAPVATTTVDDGTTVAPASSARRRPRRRRRALPSAAFRIISVLSVVICLGLWQLLASTGVIDQTLSSSPSDVWHALMTEINNGILGSAVLQSAKLFGLGVLISVLIGLFGGIALGWWRILYAIFDPWIAMAYSTPLVATFPLIIVWFGIGFSSQVVIVVLISVFPLLINVMTGTRQVDDNLLRMARSFRASQFAILRSLVLPSLVPYFVTGLRLSLGAGLIGMVLGEYFEGSGGIGGLVLDAGQELDSALVFVGIVVLAGAALTFTGLIRLVERRISAWREP
jgi:ABC-type nitrate/sulfonate/bicarbonate transport system permease component